MVSNKHPVIAREGWGLIGSALTLSAIGWYGFGLVAALPFWLGAVFLLFLFRDPRRKIPAAPLGVVCPVDGVIKSVTQSADPCLAREAVRITIQMKPLGGYSVRCPIEGKVMKQGMLSADQGTTRYALWVQTDENDDVVWSVETGSNTRRPSYYVQPGERVGQGQRCGFAFLGGTLDVFVPLGSKIGVAAGDAVSAGESLISTLVHRNAVSINGFDTRFATGG